MLGPGVVAVHTPTDDDPDHYSIIPAVPPDSMQIALDGWAAARGSQTLADPSTIHPFTQEVLDAIVNKFIQGNY